MTNEWFTGQCQITTYHLDELLGTKLRALYQRKKGRDLFDLYFADRHAELDYDQIIHCYKEYMRFVVGQSPSQNEFLKNMAEKRKSPLFSGDMQGLLSPNQKYNQEEAFDWLEENLVEKL